MFADLVGYTTLTEERGDEAAAKIAREFRRTMCALSRAHGASQVKSMGDGVMFWAPDPRAAVALASGSTRAAAGTALEPSLGPRRELALRGIARPVAARRPA